MPRCLDDRGPAAGDTQVEADRPGPDDPEPFGTPAFLEEAGALRDADLPRDPHEALAVVAVEGRGQGGARGHRSGSIRAVTADGRRGDRSAGRSARRSGTAARPAASRRSLRGHAGDCRSERPAGRPGHQGPSTPARAGRPWFAPGAQPAPVPWPPRTATARGRSPTGSRVTRPVATSTALRPFQ
ncbi:hypothetical protein GCM10010095_43270 [Streptomyces anthocyanicus]|nr:hypothetical protein JCM4020_04940 [Streptomyces coelicolor]GGL53709.1 hypothetical protein GCM10010095_43270 [Streptomyces anthocyanicus]